MGGAAAVSNVGNEHGRAAEVSFGFAAATANVDDCAVHVHLAVALVIEPRPSVSVRILYSDIYGQMELGRTRQK